MNKTLLVLLCSLLFITACGGSEPEQRPLYSGTEGVTVSFPRVNARTLYAEDIFTVSVRLENDGAADVEKGWLTAVYDPAVFAFIEGKTGTDSIAQRTQLPLEFLVRGRSRDVAVGEVDYADFTFKANKVQGNREEVASAITFQACYPYTTTLITAACIDRDIYNIELTKVCTGHDIIDANQGAPVAITRIEPSFLYNEGLVKPRFKITISNLHNGYTLWNEELVKTGKGVDLCNQQGFGREEFGRLKVTASINNVALECGMGSSKDGITRFDMNKAEILCTYPGVQPGANYEAPLIVQAQYFYVSSLTADVEVSRV